MKDKVYSMAFSRSELRNKIHNISDTFAQHALKLYLTNASTQDTNGWIHDVCLGVVKSHDYMRSLKGGRMLDVDDDVIDLLFHTANTLGQVSNSINNRLYNYADKNAQKRDQQAIYCWSRVDEQLKPDVRRLLLQDSLPRLSEIFTPEYFK